MFSLSRIIRKNAKSIDYDNPSDKKHIVNSTNNNFMNLHQEKNFRFFPKKKCFRSLTVNNSFMLNSIDYFRLKIKANKQKKIENNKSIETKNINKHCIFNNKNFLKKINNFSKIKNKIIFNSNINSIMTNNSSNVSTNTSCNYLRNLQNHKLSCQIKGTYSNVLSDVTIKTSLAEKRRNSLEMKKNDVDKHECLYISENERITYYSFKNQIISSTFTTNFIDCYFPPSNLSIISPSSKKTIEIEENEIYWLRLNEIFQGNYKIFEQENKNSTIKQKMSQANQGWMENSSVISSLICLCQEFSIIKNVFVTTTSISPEEIGQYQLLFYINSTPTLVIIDDYFPCLKGTRIPLFARCDSNNIWPMLIEKGLAKIYGSYYDLQNATVSEIIKLIANVPVETLSFENKKMVWNSIQSTFLPYHFAIATTGNETKNGLVKNASYTIMRTWEGLSLEEYYRLIKFKYPIGNKKIIDGFISSPHGDNFIMEPPYYEKIDYKWKGKYAYQSPSWTQDLKSKVGKYYDEKEKKNGFDWIGFSDFYKYFDKINKFEIILPLYTLILPLSLTQNENIFKLFIDSIFNVQISLLGDGNEFFLFKIDKPNLNIIGIGSGSIKYTNIDRGEYLVYIFNSKKGKNHITINCSGEFKISQCQKIEKGISNFILTKVYAHYLREENKESLGELTIYYGFSIPFVNLGFIAFENEGDDDFIINVKINLTQTGIINENFNDSFCYKEMYLENKTTKYIFLYSKDELGIINKLYKKIDYQVVNLKKNIVKINTMCSQNETEENQFWSFVNSVLKPINETIYSRIIPQK